MLEIQHKNDLAKLAQQHKNDKEILDKQLANEKALIAYQNEQKSVTIGGGGGGGSGASSGALAGANSATTNKKAEVSTPYYQGALNSDAKKYGTFANGYQPKGITGHGTLKKSGKTVSVATEILYGANKGQKQTLTQTVWKAEDGSLWYWEGRQNKYIRLDQTQKPSTSAGGGGNKAASSGGGGGKYIHYAIK
jgi:hypothetical protein